MKVTVTVADAEKARKRMRQVARLRGRFGWWHRIWFGVSYGRAYECPLAQSLKRNGVSFPAVLREQVFDCGRGHQLTDEARAFVSLADVTHDDPITLGLPREIEVWAD